jgi:hypothetical protein
MHAEVWIADIGTACYRCPAERYRPPELAHQGTRLMQDLDRDKHVSVHAESLKALIRFAEKHEDYVLAAKAE